MSDFLSNFAHPGSDYRGKPFWSWNGELDETELLRQIHVLKDMGMGGFFMHSRTGLATEYLGDEWFRLTNVCADEAAKLGLEAWLYDEDRWPSGTAGGMVTKEPTHRAKFISLHFVAPGEYRPDASDIAAFVCRRTDLSVTGVRRLKPGESAGNAGDTVLVFRVEVHAESTFYNGATYVDTLSRLATDAYLKITHDQYQARCGDRLGSSIRGIFTDEPHRGPVMCGFSIGNANRLWMAPWTETLFAEFKAAFGYDLIDKLPELFLQVDGNIVSPVKWQYMELLQRLFLQNFAKPMFDWCTDHKMILTGHVLHEDSLTAQAAMQGSMMRFYEFMHWPGIDILSEGNRCYWVAKQLSSAARQLGQPWMLSELYGCTGWQMDFAGHKAVGDWQALFGINVRCHHLSWVTMAGEAKRDYPASISFQSAWWPQYKFVEDYFSRLGVLLAHGKPVCDVLVINPVESVWCQIHGGWANSLSPTQPAVKELDAKYAELFHWLAGARIDFDYADEEMMSRLASVEKNADGDAVFRVGQATYATIVVGHQTTIRSSTLKLLKTFADAGGEVIFAGDPPPYVDAVASDAAADLADATMALPWERDMVVAACTGDPIMARVDVWTSEGKTAENIFAQVRYDEAGTVYVVLLNVDRENALPGCRVRVSGVSGAVAEWVCESGERFAVDTKANDKATDDGVTFAVDFAAGGLHAFAISPNAAVGLSSKPKLAEVARHELAGPFAFELAEPNVCVLDVATYAIDGGEEQSLTEVLKIDRAVRTAFGLKMRSGEMVQPWFHRKTESTSPTMGAVRMTFSFDVGVMPTAAVELAIETPKRFAVTLNGRPIDTAGDTGWWIDPAIRTVRLPADAIVAGENQLTLKVDFEEGDNLEAVYLLGTFGVALTGRRATLTTLPKSLMPTDVAAQGLPFYGGAIRYLLPTVVPPGRRLQLDVTGVAAACATVGDRVMAWHPMRADVTDAVTDGGLALDVVLTRRNTFGPLHQLPLLTANYGPGNWVTSGKSWSDDYVLHPAGLQRAPVLIEAVESV